MFFRILILVSIIFYLGWGRVNLREVKLWLKKRMKGEKLVKGIKVEKERRKFL